MVQTKYTARCKRSAKKNLHDEKYDAQVKVIGKAVMIAGNIMLFSIL